MGFLFFQCKFCRKPLAHTTQRHFPLQQCNERKDPLPSNAPTFPCSTCAHNDQLPPPFLEGEGETNKICRFIPKKKKVAGCDFLTRV